MPTLWKHKTEEKEEKSILFKVFQVPDLNIYIFLVPKGVQMGGGFLTVNKIRLKHFVLLLLCVCVHNWSVSQWKQYELQIWSSWRNILF